MTLQFFINELVSSQTNSQKNNIELGITSLPLVTNELIDDHPILQDDNSLFINNMQIQIKFLSLELEKQLLLSNLSTTSKKRQKLFLKQNDNINTSNPKSIEIKQLKPFIPIKTNVQLHNEEKEIRLVQKAQIFLKDIHYEKDSQLAMLREQKRKERDKYLKMLENDIKVYNTKKLKKKLAPITLPNESSHKKINSLGHRGIVKSSYQRIAIKNNRNNNHYLYSDRLKLPPIKNSLSVKRINDHIYDGNISLNKSNSPSNEGNSNSYLKNGDDYYNVNTNQNNISEMKSNVITENNSSLNPYYFNEPKYEKMMNNQYKKQYKKDN